MPDDAIRVKVLLRQQAALAKFGSFALREGDLHKVLTEAARVCAEGLSVPFCKVCHYRPEENDLLVEAGFGWKAGVIGIVVSRADASSPQGRTFTSGKPAICNDLRKDNEFKLPAFYAAHGVVSTIDVIIKGEGEDEPYGVLEIDNDKQHDYDQSDINFLTGFANVLAEAVATSARTSVLKRTIERMEGLLDQKNVLAEELQHRVRNNMQLVYGMLGKQLADTVDEAGQRGLKAIARRVRTLAQVYDHLLGNEITRTTDFGAYANSLCHSLAEIQGVPNDAVMLTCESVQVMLDLDAVTALGIVLAELVTNSYDHAFPAGKGTINVSLRSPVGEDAMATMTILDDGPGFDQKIENKRHGLGLVRRLVEQVRGTLTLDADHHTAWTIKFPVAA
jgi:two-component sensor histidine kinase